MRIRLILTAVLAAISSVATAGDLVVIASDQPRLEVGSIVSGDRQIQIADGKKVTLISSQGREFRLTGPYSGTIDQSPTESNGLLKALSELVAKDRNPRTTLAVFRGIPKRHPTGRPDIWGVDVTRSGRYCLRRDQPVALWWPTAEYSAQIALRNTASGNESAIAWPAGVKTVKWPSALAIVDGGSYVAAGASSNPAEVTLVRIPTLRTNSHRAAWMAEHGCDRQALAVLNAIANGEL